MFIAGYSQNNIVAPDYYTKFYSYTTNQGLSCSEVLDVMQDKYGFIWVATKNGLNKFDGQSFTQFFKIENKAGSLCDNLVTCLAEDIYGTVWIGTANGLCKYVRSKNCFEEISSEGGLKDNDIRALYADKNDNLWIDTRKGGLNCLKINVNQVEVYPTTLSPLKGIISIILFLKIPNSGYGSEAAIFPQGIWILKTILFFLKKASMGTTAALFLKTRTILYGLQAIME